MGFPGWIAVRYEYRRQIGRALSFIRLHRLEYTTLHGVDVVRKRRKWLACWLIPLGYQFLKISGNPVVALSTKHWIDWERAIDRAIEQDRVFPAANDGSSSGRDLVSRKVPGISLHDLLSNSQYSLSQKMDMIRWSLVALRTLHRCHADWGDGRHQSISHGDATSRNVIVDLDRAAACWIDFDIRHRPEISEWDRQADDLRALVFSSAVELPESSFPELAIVIKSIVARETFFERLCTRFETHGADLTTFQLAQSPLPLSKLRLLQSAILTSFNAID